MSSITKIGVDPIEGIYIETLQGLSTVRKFIELADLKDALISDIQIQTPLLPTNCKYYAEGNGYKYVIIELPNTPQMIKYHPRGGGDILTKKIPLPFTIFGFAIQGSAIRKSLCVTSPMRIVGDDSPLYRFPFGNVYQDLRVCWGNTRLPSVQSPVQLSGIPDLFYLAPFNGDLMTDNSFRTARNTNWIDFLESLENQEIFPLDEMVENTQTRTFGDFVRYLTDNRN